MRADDEDLRGYGKIEKEGGGGGDQPRRSWGRAGFGIRFIRAIRAYLWIGPIVPASAILTGLALPCVEDHSAPSLRLAIRRKNRGVGPVGQGLDTARIGHFEKTEEIALTCFEQTPMFPPALARPLLEDDAAATSESEIPPLSTDRSASGPTE